MWVPDDYPTCPGPRPPGILPRSWRGHNADRWRSTYRHNLPNNRGPCTADLGWNIVSIRTANPDILQVRHQCVICERVMPFALPYDQRQAQRFEVVRANDPRPPEVCERCGALGRVELHHYGPWSVFGPDAESWAMGKLCVDCHQTWHRKMDDHTRKIGLEGVRTARQNLRGEL